MLPKKTKLWDPSWIGLGQKKNKRDLHKVWEIKTMKRKPREEHARKILEEVATQVEPIMIKHKLRVKLLSEFCNRRIRGLNVFKGREVKLCVRNVDREDEFVPFVCVLDTMLHELCHNVHAVPDARFHKLWAELREEYVELVAKGIIKPSSKEFDVGRWMPFPPLPAPPVSMLEDLVADIKRMLGDVISLSSVRKTLLAVMAKISQLISLLLAGMKAPWL